MHFLLVPAGPPLSVAAASTSSTSIRISWQAPALELQNGGITAYRINIMELETGRLLTFVTVSSDSIFVVNSLHPFYYYNCSVAAYTNGQGPSSHYVVQTLAEGLLGYLPRNFIMIYFSCLYRTEPASH